MAIWANYDHLQWILSGHDHVPHTTSTVVPNLWLMAIDGRKFTNVGRMKNKRTTIMHDKQQQ